MSGRDVFAARSASKTAPSAKWLALAPVAILVTIAIALVLDRTTTSGPSPITGVQAREVLNKAVGAALMHDWDAFCDPAAVSYDIGCQQDLEDWDQRVPAEAPLIARDSIAAGGQGWRFILCGFDGLGEPYRNDFVVYLKAGGARAAKPVWWQNLTFEFIEPEDPAPAPGPHIAPSWPASDNLAPCKEAGLLPADGTSPLGSGRPYP